MRIRQSILKFLACFALLFILRGKAFAQPYPVTATIQLTAPSIPYYDGFTIVTDNKLISTIILNDVTKPFYNVRLKVTISGEGITLTSSIKYTPKPLTLYYNVPVLLTGADLSPYFNPDNLDFYGISKEEFLKQGKLKEGIYSICIEALDYQRYTDPPVSNRACTNGLLIEHDPPRILTCIGKQKYILPQNYQFTWQPLHVGAFPVEYELEIFELSNGITADQALQYKIQPVITKTVTRTTYWYQPSDPLLKTDTEYLVRVRAKDVTNQNQFKNDGYSQHEIFVITTDCEIGSACDDGNPCTINDIFTGKCTCVGEYLPDTDGDGVCDVLDICANGADDVDVDGDCIPDACDDCVVGASCDDGDPCTEGDRIFMNAEGECICMGKIVRDSDDDTYCDAIDLCPGGDDNLDADGDKLPDACDDCIVGKKCDDGDPHTFNDMMIWDPQYPEGAILPSWVEPCICRGTPCASDPLNDSDGDGICNESDPCPGVSSANGAADSDGDGIPNCMECEATTNINMTKLCSYEEWKLLAAQAKKVVLYRIGVMKPFSDEIIELDATTLGFHFPYECEGDCYGPGWQPLLDDINNWLAANHYLGFATYEANKVITVKWTNVKFVFMVVKEDDGAIFKATFNEVHCYTNSTDGKVTLYVETTNTQPITSYLWSTGATTPTIEVPLPISADNNFSVTITFADGCVDIITLPTTELCIPGTPCDDNFSCTINDQLNLECLCIGTYAGDADDDGVCDPDDSCPGIPDIPGCNTNCTPGTPCDDGQKCTINDVYQDNCQCKGICNDDDADGICNEEDKCPGFPDHVDFDRDGVPDKCDENGLCDIAFSPNSPPNTLELALINKLKGCTNLKSRKIKDILNFQQELKAILDDEQPECTGMATPVGAQYYDIDMDSDGLWDYLDMQPCISNAQWTIYPVADFVDYSAITYDMNNCVPQVQPNLGVIIQLMFDFDCDDGDACTVFDQVNCDCECKGILLDSDSDGVCDAKDQCHGGQDIILDDEGEMVIRDFDGDGVDDNVDLNGNEIPDACEELSAIVCQFGEHIGTPCTTPEPREFEDENGNPVEPLLLPNVGVWTYDKKKMRCICLGVPCDDSDNDLVCDELDKCQGYPDIRVVTQTLGPNTTQITLTSVSMITTDLGNGKFEYSLDPTGNAPLVNIDIDGDGIVNACDACPENPLGDIGTPCDDGDPRTINDAITGNIVTTLVNDVPEYTIDGCDCKGLLLDTDGDGVYNGEDVCEGYDDVNAPDYDDDGIPDACDPPWYEIGCPVNIQVVDGEAKGLRLIYNSTVTIPYTNFPNPISLKVQYGTALYEKTMVPLSGYRTILGANNTLQQYELYFEMADMPTTTILAAPAAIYYIRFSEHQNCMFSIGDIGTTGGSNRPDDEPAIAPVNPNLLMNLGCPTTFSKDADNKLTFGADVLGVLNLFGLPTSFEATELKLNDNLTLNGNYQITANAVTPIIGGSNCNLVTTFPIPVQVITPAVTANPSAYPDPNQTPFTGVTGMIVYNTGLTCNYTAGVIATLNCPTSLTPATDCNGEPLPVVPHYLGEPCSDCNPLTINDAYNANCECKGEIGLDSDNDGVADAIDQCPGSPDGVDVEPANGVPDGCECATPVIIKDEIADGNDLILTVAQNDAHKSYILSYKLSEETDFLPANTITTTDLMMTMKNLLYDANYDVELRAVCHSDFTSVPYVTSAYIQSTEQNVNCGVAIVPDLLNETLLASCAIGDTIVAGDFKVIITTISGSEGVFTGMGYIFVPNLNYVRLNVEFKDITLNDTKQLILGKIKVTGAGLALIDGDMANALTDALSVLSYADGVLEGLEEAITAIEAIVQTIGPYLPTTVTTSLTAASTALQNCEAQPQPACTNAQAQLAAANGQYTIAVAAFLEDFLEIVKLAVAKLNQDCDALTTTGLTLEEDYNEKKLACDNYYDNKYTETITPLLGGTGLGENAIVVESFDLLVTSNPNDIDPVILTASESFYLAEKKYMRCLALEKLGSEVNTDLKAFEFASLFLNTTGFNLIDYLGAKMKAAGPSPLSQSVREAIATSSYNNTISYIDIGNELEKLLIKKAYNK